MPYLFLSSVSGRGRSGAPNRSTPLVRSEVDPQCSCASTWADFERAIRLLETGRIDAIAFIDIRFSLRDHEATFEAYLAGETCKPVFDATELR